MRRLGPSVRTVATAEAAIAECHCHCHCHCSCPNLRSQRPVRQRLQVG
jgi:hypothetical protein